MSEAAHRSAMRRALTPGKRRTLWERFLRWMFKL